MIERVRHRPFAWLLAGMVAGMVLSGFWPQTPLHAVSTDRMESFAIATGLVDEEVEALYLLDFLTGDLRAAVLGRNNKFQGFYQHNILKDFNLDPSRNPKFLMVTGNNQYRRGAGNLQLGYGILYVAEVTTGQAVAYGLPWVPNSRSIGVATKNQLVPLDIMRFRSMPLPVGGAGP